MGKITISADTLEEVLAIADSLRPDTGTDAPAAPGEAPKPTRTRKKAEAPAPAQPEQAQAAPPPPPPQGNPFGQPAQPQAAPGFAPQQEAPTFNPAAGNPHANSHAERPIVTQVKDALGKLAAQHGEPQVFAWAIQKCLGLPASVQKDEFLATYIHQQPDDKLAEVLRVAAGGK